MRVSKLIRPGNSWLRQPATAARPRLGPNQFTGAKVGHHSLQSICVRLLAERLRRNYSSRKPAVRINCTEIKHCDENPLASFLGVVR